MTCPSVLTGRCPGAGRGDEILIPRSGSSGSSGVGECFERALILSNMPINIVLYYISSDKGIAMHDIARSWSSTAYNIAATLFHHSEGQEERRNQIYLLSLVQANPIIDNTPIVHSTYT